MKRFMLLSVLFIIVANVAFSAVYDRKLARDTERHILYCAGCFGRFFDTDPCLLLPGHRAYFHDDENFQGVP